MAVLMDIVTSLIGGMCWILASCFISIMINYFSDDEKELKKLTLREFVRYTIFIILLGIKNTVVTRRDFYA